MSSARRFLEREEKFEIAFEIFLSIKPAVKNRPCSRRAVDHAEVGFAGPVVERAVSFGEKIVRLDVGFGEGDVRQSFANAAGRGVMTFSEPGGENENFFQLVRRFRPGVRRRV